MNMSGRRLFSLVKPALQTAVWLLRCLPRWVSYLMLHLCRSWSGGIGVALRYVLVARLAKSCGDCVAVFEGVYLRGIEQMELGAHVSIHPMCYVDGTGGLRIGTEVSIAHASTIMTTEHDYSHATLPTRRAPVLKSSVVIGDNVWIGCGVRVLAGACIGSNSVVGAGAVVTKTVPENMVAAGVPARSIRIITSRAA